MNGIDRLPARRFFKGITGTLATRGTGVVLGLLLQVLTARLLGVSGTGALYTALSALTLGAVLLRMGADVALTRHAGPALASGRHDEAAVAFGSALMPVAAIGAASGLAVWLLIEAVAWTGHFADSVGLWRLCALLLPLLMINPLQAAMLRALGLHVRAAAIEIAIPPAATLLILAVMLTQGELSPARVCAAMLAAQALALACSAWALRRRLDGRAVLRGLRKGRIAPDAISLAGIDGLNNAPHAAVTLVGVFAGLEAAGIFGIAQRVSSQLATVGVVIGTTLAPRMAALHAAKDAAGLQHTLNLGRVAMFALALPVATVLVVWPQALTWILGAHFAAAEPALQLLALAQLVAMLTGPCGYLLLMAEQSQGLRNLMLWSTGFGLIGTPLAAVALGPTGAAAAAAISLVAQKILTAHLAHQRLDLGWWPRPATAPVRSLPCTETS